MFYAGTGHSLYDIVEPWQVAVFAIVFLTLLFSPFIDWQIWKWRNRNNLH